MPNELQVALISGSAYDPLYTRLSKFTELTGIKVKVVFSGDHPTLNRHLAALPEIPYDLISTHTKYAPSQLTFLAPLDDLIDAARLEDFVPRLLELASIDRALYGLPRNIDARLLHYRTDIIETPPQTWDELFEVASFYNSPPDLYGFVFPGRESGLFGTFYELAEMAGAQLFPPDLVPDIENEAARWALELLRGFYKKGIVPNRFTNWHFEQVHEIFRSGHAAMVGDFPGVYSLYQDPRVSVVGDRLGLSPYPTGPAGTSLAYGGGHTFGLTLKGAENPYALELLMFLTDFEQQLLEARHGSVPVRRSVMTEMKDKANDFEYARLEMLENVISEHILIPPKFARFPQIEEVVWLTVQRAILGQKTIDAALHFMREQIQQIVYNEKNKFRWTKDKSGVVLNRMT